MENNKIKIMKKLLKNNYFNPSSHQKDGLKNNKNNYNYKK